LLFPYIFHGYARFSISV